MTSKKGFTLLELLIVVAIIAILAGAILVVINPAEILKKARDSQRVSDLTSLKSAIGLYLVDVSNPALDNSTSSDRCTNYIYYTLVDTGGANYGCMSTSEHCIYPSSTSDETQVDGAGWIPVNFTDISSGSPIASLPIDPTNSGHYYYTYACNDSSLTFEIDAKLESTYYTTTKQMPANDGGDSTDLYEVGTAPGLNLLGTPTNTFYE